MGWTSIAQKRIQRGRQGIQTSSKITSGYSFSLEILVRTPHEKQFNLGPLQKTSKKKTTPKRQDGISGSAHLVSSTADRIELCFVQTPKTGNKKLIRQIFIPRGRISLYNYYFYYYYSRDCYYYYY